MPEWSVGEWVGAISMVVMVITHVVQSWRFAVSSKVDQARLRDRVDQMQECIKGVRADFKGLATKLKALALRSERQGFLEEKIDDLEQRLRDGSKKR